MAPIAITMGDPCGIGPEIVAKLFNHRNLRETIVIGDPRIMERAAKLVGVDLKIHPIQHPKEARFAAKTIDVVASSRLSPEMPFGQVNRAAGAAAYDYIKQSVDYALKNEIRAVVTAPIHKEALHLAGIQHPGHTEIFAALTGTRDFAMMLVNQELRVLLATVHVSLSEAIKSIKVENQLKSIRLADRAVRRFGIAQPRVAVAGLNPHAGENGLFGREDLDQIRPAVERARAENIDASGPWPADTLFMRARRREFDVVVAQYHDQGLIPIKYLGLDHGVNITVGLPFVRTSVDHGTAFEIAGTGVADFSSLEAALNQAIVLIKEKP